MVTYSLQILHSTLFPLVIPTAQITSKMRQNSFLIYLSVYNRVVEGWLRCYGVPATFSHTLHRGRKYPASVKRACAMATDESRRQKRSSQVCLLSISLLHVCALSLFLHQWVSLYFKPILFIPCQSNVPEATTPLSHILVTWPPWPC